MMEKFKELEGKRVFIELKTGRRYSGVIQTVENDFVKILDKYKMLVYIDSAEIRVCQEEA
ncbi:hypothetical protein LCGC14_3083270 [marine sediment metagenome]|uniref:Sm domain-containing protein n=1 Tax=marine sediment metagenome TaxID=412755 RepID=A0A0F8Z3D3_9ZZZZ